MAADEQKQTEKQTEEKVQAERAEAAQEQTVTVTDLHGDEVEVPAGMDGENPVSPNNPPLKAVAEADREEALAARQAEIEAAEGLAEISGAGENAAATNKEDNAPTREALAAESATSESPGSKTAAKKSK